VGAGGIDVTAALRPETHHLLRPDQLAVVQVQLGHTLRDVYLQMVALGVGSMLCALWLPDKHETLAAADPEDRDRDEFGDEDFATAASEL
jgi:hypothetical protein